MAGVPRSPAGRIGRRLALIASLVLAAGMAMPQGRAAEPVVRAVLFFSPTCPHCHTVLEEVLPPLFSEHGGPAEVIYDETLPPGQTSFYLMTNGRLEVLVADVSVQDGSRLFYAATEAFGIASQGVPRLIAADRVMIGSVEIPEQFPGIVSAALDAGDTIDWPAIPGIEAAVAATGVASETTTTTQPPATTTTTATTSTAPAQGGTSQPGGGSDTTGAGEAPPATAAPTPAPRDLPVLPAEGGGQSVWDRFRQDVTGNSISVVVLAVMVAALAATALGVRRPARPEATPSWLIPLLAGAGLVVASYLAFVEVGGTEAVCGPVGDCNAVQASEYARLFGVIPVGVIGVAGYLVVIAAWAITRFASRPAADWAAVALAAGAIAGTLLSVYLTFLEPFVIGATCMWCITSAVVITLIMWLSTGPARSAYQRLERAA